jgi:hypothetical protein
VQNAKDTFYEVLRNRLVAFNPERTIVLRGVVRSRRMSCSQPWRFLTVFVCDGLWRKWMRMV